MLEGAEQGGKGGGEGKSHDAECPLSVLQPTCCSHHTALVELQKLSQRCSQSAGDTPMFLYQEGELAQTDVQCAHVGKEAEEGSSGAVASSQRVEAYHSLQLNRLLARDGGGTCIGHSGSAPPTRTHLPILIAGRGGALQCVQAVHHQVSRLH